MANRIILKEGGLSGFKPPVGYKFLGFDNGNLSVNSGGVITIPSDPEINQKIDTILDGTTTDLDTFKEVIDFVSGIDVENDLTLLNKIDQVNDRVDAEVADVKNDDSVISDELNNHVISTSNDVSVVTTAIETEVSDRVSAINALSDSFNNLKDSIDTDILGLNTSIASETERAVGVENSLDISIKELEKKLSDTISGVNEVNALNFDSVYAKKVGVTFSGTQSFVTLDTPVKPESMMLYINGLIVENGVDYTESLNIDGLVTGATLSGDALDLAVAGGKLVSYGVYGTLTNINL